MSETVHIDARGLLCPLPVLRLRKVLIGLPPGSRVKIETDDPVAVVDIPHFCQEEGHALVLNEPAGDGHRFTVIRS